MPGKETPASSLARSSATCLSVAALSCSSRAARWAPRFETPNSRAGQISTLSSAPMVWPVEATTRRRPSTSSPQNSARTGDVIPEPKMSTLSPWMQKLPGPSSSSRCW